MKMLHKLSLQFSSFLVQKGLPEKNQAIYAYGTECFLNMSITYTILLLWSIFTNCFFHMLLWLLCFSFLRNHIGGLHANTHLKCIISSIILGITSLYIKDIFVVNLYLTAIILILCFVVILIIAPVTHENNPLSYKAKKTERKKGIIIFLLEIIFVTVVYFVQPKWCAAIISGIIMSVLFCILGYIRNTIIQKAA